MEVEVIVADYLNKKHGSDIVQLLNSYAEDPMCGGEPLSSSTASLWRKKTNKQ